MTWFLILTIFTGDPSSAMSETTAVPFKTQSACKVAGSTAYREIFRQMGLSSAITVSFVCVPDPDPPKDDKK